MGIIYKVTNIEDDPLYVGKSKSDLQDRIVNHKKAAFITNSKSQFHTALRQYPFEYFQWEVVKVVENKLLDYWEIQFIEFFDTYNNGYNMTTGGPGSSGRFGSIGYVHNEVRRKKISDRFKGKPKTLEHRQKLGEARTAMKGTFHLTDEHKETLRWARSTVLYFIQTPDPEECDFWMFGMQAFCNCRNLSGSAMSRVANGKRNHHKGYKVQKIA